MTRLPITVISRGSQRAFILDEKRWLRDFRRDPKLVAINYNSE